MRLMSLPRPSALVTIAVLAGCATVVTGCASVPPLPPINDGAAQAAPYPALIPLGPVIAAAGAPSAPAQPPQIDSRLAGLAARAAALRGPVVDDATSRRLAASLR